MVAPAGRSALTVQSVRMRTLLVAPVRLVLGVVWLAAALVDGAAGTSALLAFATGGLALVFLLFNDPRSRFQRIPQAQPLPAEAVVAPAWRHALDAAFPSTVGVSVLAAISLAFEAVLTAFLGGVVVGLGIGALARARSIDGSLYTGSGGRALYRK